MKPSEGVFFFSMNGLCHRQRHPSNKSNNSKDPSHSTDSTFSIGGGVRAPSPLFLIGPRKETLCQPHHRNLACIPAAAPWSGTDRAAAPSTRRNDNSKSRNRPRATTRRVERRPVEAMAPSGSAPGLPISWPTRFASAARRRGGSSRRPSSITSSPTRGTRPCSGIRATGRRYASHATTARRPPRMGDGATRGGGGKSLACQNGKPFGDVFFFALRVWGRGGFLGPGSPLLSDQGGGKGVMNPWDRYQPRPFCAPQSLFRMHA